MQVLRQLPQFDDPNILVGGTHMDDAAVYKIDENIAIVQTVDILTPIADDPYIFGQIAAANSLSDIYAMGAKPISALSILCYPPDKIDSKIVITMLQGVVNKVKEAEACIIGGHTLKDTEVKCGLAVIGLIAPDKIIKNSGAKPGDILILTKPLGTGVLSTAIKENLVSEQTIHKLNDIMCALNKEACAAMLEIGVSSATDITGFGLLGHCLEIAEASNVSIKINASQVPLIENTLEFARENLFPSGSKMNFEYIKPKTRFEHTIDPKLQLILCDAQTSGGLLISVSLERSEALLSLLVNRGASLAQVVGEVIEPAQRRIYVE